MGGGTGSDVVGGDADGRRFAGTEPVVGATPKGTFGCVGVVPRITSKCDDLLEDKVDVMVAGEWGGDGSAARTTCGGARLVGELDG